ncbi:MAG: hypothetical protein AAFZ92_09725, partial [Pseudomonadota bacterium]
NVPMSAIDPSKKGRVIYRMVNRLAAAALLLGLAYVFIDKILNAHLSQQWANKAFHNHHFFSQSDLKPIESSPDKPKVYDEYLVDVYYVPTGLIRGNLQTWHTIESRIVTNLDQYQVKGNVRFSQQDKTVSFKSFGEKNHGQAICIASRCYPLIARSSATGAN